MRHPVPPDARPPLSTVDGPEKVKGNRVMKKHLRSLVTFTPHSCCISRPETAVPRNALAGCCRESQAVLRHRTYTPSHVLLSDHVGQNRQVVVCVVAIQWLRWIPIPASSIFCPRSHRAGVHTPHSPTSLAGLQQVHGSPPKGIRYLDKLVQRTGFFPGPTGTRTCQARTQPAQRAANPDCQAVSMRSPEAFSHPITGRRFGSRLRFRKPFFSLLTAKRARAQTPCQFPSDATALSGLTLGRRAVLSSKWAQYAKARDEHGRRVSGDSPWEFPSLHSFTASHPASRRTD